MGERLDEFDAEGSTVDPASPTGMPAVDHLLSLDSGHQQACEITIGESCSLATGHVHENQVSLAAWNRQRIIGRRRLVAGRNRLCAPRQELSATCHRRPG